MAEGFQQKQDFRSALLNVFGVTAKSFNFTSTDAVTNLNRKIANVTNNKISDLFRTGNIFNPFFFR